MMYDTKKKKKTTELIDLIPNFWEGLLHRPRMDYVVSVRSLRAKDGDHRVKYFYKRSMCANEVWQVRW